MKNFLNISDLSKKEINTILNISEDSSILLNKNLCLFFEKYSKRPRLSFNVGINNGKYAGQTVKQAHIHIIPRYKGDVKDPVGGVRSVIPKKRKYK